MKNKLLKFIDDLKFTVELLETMKGTQEAPGQILVLENVIKKLEEIVDSE